MRHRLFWHHTTHKRTFRIRESNQRTLISSMSSVSTAAMYSCFATTQHISARNGNVIPKTPKQMFSCQLITDLYITHFTPVQFFAHGLNVIHCGFMFHGIFKKHKCLQMVRACYTLLIQYTSIHIHISVMLLPLLSSVFACLLTFMLS